MDSPTTDDLLSPVERDLLSMLSNQMLESELIWNFLWSTSEHYKIDSLLRPFPKMFIANDNKMFDKLRLVMLSVGKLQNAVDKLISRSLQLSCVQLLDWALRSGAFRFQAVPRESFYEIMGKVQQIKDITAFPKYIFHVDSSERASYRRFRDLAKQYGSRFAFHGSRLENYFSILHNGLQVNMNKVAAFGPGVYLSSDLQVSLVFSPCGIGSPDSIFGDTFAVVALCEIIDHPDVKCQHDKDVDRKYASGRRSPQVPNKYFIVQNSDMVYVRYLLVFPGFSRSAIQKRLSSFPVKLSGCFIVLLLVVFYNSQVLIRFLRVFLKFLIQSD